MSTDPSIPNLLSKFVTSTHSGGPVPSARLSSTQGEQIEKTAASRGTAREVIDAKPADLVVPATPNTTPSEQSGGESKK